MTKPLLNRTRPSEIVKAISPDHTGIQLHATCRHTIGYVLSGRKLIYDGNECREIAAGEIFCLECGNNYVEDIPARNAPAEQIHVLYDQEVFSRAMIGLNLEYGFRMGGVEKCSDCGDRRKVSFRADTRLKSCFESMDAFIGSGILSDDPVLREIKVLELLYIIMSGGECCLRSRLLGNNDTLRDNFDGIIRSNIFTGITIESLARRCNRSLTSFKQEFRRHYGMPPHRWFIRQRLMHARVLLMSGGRSVSEIGNECRFANTSHFIKLFKREFGITPALYKSHYGSCQAAKNRGQAKKSKVMA